MAINWTKYWQASDDGTIVKGSDLKNLQDDINANLSSGSSASSYTKQFTSGDLSANILTVNHQLSSDYPTVTVWNNSDEIVFPDEVTRVDGDSNLIDFTTWAGAVSGTWKVKEVA